MMGVSEFRQITIGRATRRMPPAFRQCARLEEKTMATPSEMSAATPMAPLGLVGYQEGAVVSRTLLKRAGGTITLFAFDEGQSLSEHTAPFDAVSHVLEGEADITIAGTVHNVSAGDLMLMPTHQPHAVHARTRFKMLLTMVRSI
jgi:quercetin dioxygenase-like cupin family protein